MSARRIEWPGGATTWIEDRTLFVSVPFTWDLPEIRALLVRPNLLWDSARVGGPAIQLMPDYLDGIEHVTVGGDMPGVLQRVNPQATRTTTGCPNRCWFCGIGRGRIEPGGLVELEDWPDLPVLTDNNILAASRRHFDRVMERLDGHGWGDFNQGIDARLLTKHHARRFARVPGLMIRLALDSMTVAPAWSSALRMLLNAGVPRSRIRSYCLIGFNSEPAEAWARCLFVESYGIKPLPMWFHPLDLLVRNVVTEHQLFLGWTDEERKTIMQWFYKHRDRNGRASRWIERIAA